MTEVTKPGGIIACIPFPELNVEDHTRNTSITIKLDAISFDSDDLTQPPTAYLMVKYNYIDLETGLSTDHVLTEGTITLSPDDNSDDGGDLH